MLPTRQEIVDEAETILVMAHEKAMYAAVLATAIAGQLNEQAHASLYDPPPWDALISALESDPRYAIRDGVAGLPIVELTSPISQVRRSGTHPIATLDDDSAAEIASLARCAG